MVMTEFSSQKSYEFHEQKKNPLKFITEGAALLSQTSQRYELRVKPIT